MNRWTKKEIEYLKENYEKSFNPDIAIKLNKTVSSVSHKANRMGLKTVAKHRTGRIGWNKGLTKETDERVRKMEEKSSKTRKERHIIPWNKNLTNRKAKRRIGSSKIKSKIPRKELINLYLDKQKSIVELSKIYNHCQGYLKRVMKEYGIPLRNQKESASLGNKDRIFSDESIELMKKTRRKMVEEGRMKIWNEGLTKETDERLKLAGEKCSKTKLRLFKEGKLVISESQKKAMSWLGKKHPIETIEKFKKSKENYNPWDYIKNPEEVRAKIKIATQGINKGVKRPELTRRNLDPEFQRKCRRNIRPNKPETVLINLIKKNNLPFNYVGDGKIWFKGQNTIFNPDFLSKNPRHIIEMYGDYWHNLPKAKIRDKERVKTYKKFGYKTLIIWEHELKSPNQVLNRIQEFVK